MGKILKSAPQKWKKLPISRAKNDRENSIFFRSRSQKKRLKIRSKSDLVSRVKRDWKSDRKRIVRSDFDLFRSSSSLLCHFHNREKFIGTAYAGLYDYEDEPQAYQFDKDLVTCYPNNKSPGNYMFVSFFITYS